MWASSCLPVLCVCACVCILADDDRRCAGSAVIAHVCKRVQEHAKFVNSVRYSPDGNLFVSIGADGKVSVLITDANMRACMWVSE